MRWPIRIQILAPLAALMLITLAGVSALNAYFSAQMCRQHIQQQLANVVRTLNESSIPIAHDAVLAQMRGLSGAEYVLTDVAGRVQSTSRREWTLPALSRPTTESADLTLSERIEVGGHSYFHATAAVRDRTGGEAASVLHILYPVENYQEFVRQGFVPPLIVGGLALALAIALAAIIAAHVTRPIQRLRRHVQQISQGNFQPTELPRRNDELRDLAGAVNHMAELLSQYADEVRRSEKLRTLGQLGGGLAHQLRNSATGCRMALELHRRECPLRDDCENLDVAARQLTLMERYLERFLAGRSGRERPHAPLNLGELLDNAAALVRPAAKHHGVQLDWTAPPTPLLARGDATELEQVFVNLLVNGFEAAVGYGRTEAAKPKQPRVAMTVGMESSGVDSSGAAASDLIVEVSDNGPGPAAAVRNSLFEPLVTDKSDGTGLGLSVAREIVRRHSGELSWRRFGSAGEEQTCFRVRLPLHVEETARVEVAGR